MSISELQLDWAFMQLADTRLQRSARKVFDAFGSQALSHLQRSTPVLEGLIIPWAITQLRRHTELPSLRQTLAELTTLHVPLSSAISLVRTYQTAAVRRLLNNPYLGRQHHLSLEACDALAQRQHISWLDPRRSAAIAGDLVRQYTTLYGHIDNLQHRPLQQVIVLSAALNRERCQGALPTR